MLTGHTLGSWSCICKCGRELGPSGPQVKVEPESPFIQAAWEGNVSLIRAMLKGFPGVIDINHTASVTPLHKHVTTKRYPCSCHHTTALRAAVCNDHLEVVQVLIKFGPQSTSVTVKILHLFMKQRHKRAQRWWRSFTSMVHTLMFSIQVG